VTNSCGPIEKKLRVDAAAANSLSLFLFHVILDAAQGFKDALDFDPLHIDLTQFLRRGFNLSLKIDRFLRQFVQPLQIAVPVPLLTFLRAEPRALYHCDSHVRFLPS